MKGTIDMKKILIFALSLLIMVGSFSATTFAAEADTTGKTNYALTGEVIARPNCYTSQPVTLLNDGEKYNDAYVGGNSTAEGKNPGFTMDLGEEKYIDTVCVYHRSGYGITYTVSVSNDKSVWSEVGTTSESETVSVSSGSENKNTSYTTLQFTEVKARYVKLTGTVASKHRAMEIEVWGTPKTNIATGKTYTAYTTEGWYNDRTKVNDGDLSTEGSTKSTANTSYRLNLDDYYEIEEVTLYCRDNKAMNFTVKLGVDADKELDFVVGTTAVEADYSLTVGEHTLVKCSLDFSKGNVAKYVCIPITGQVYIREIVVYGKKVEAPTMGNITETADSEAGTTAVKLDVINGGATDITGNVYAAIYDDNDMLSAVYKAANTVTVANGAYTTLDDIVLNAASGNLKLFLWTDTLIPLCAAK